MLFVAIGSLNMLGYKAAIFFKSYKWLFYPGQECTNWAIFFNRFISSKKKYRNILDYHSKSEYQLSFILCIIV